MGDFSAAELLEMGYTEAELEQVREEGLRFYSVTVLDECDCCDCKAGRRWFYCRNTGGRTIKEYAVMGDGGPLQTALREIEAKHPGKIFLYA